MAWERRIAEMLLECADTFFHYLHLRRLKLVYRWCTLTFEKKMSQKKEKCRKWGQKTTTWSKKTCPIFQILVWHFGYFFKLIYFSQFIFWTGSYLPQSKDFWFSVLNESTSLSLLSSSKNCLFFLKFKLESNNVFCVNKQNESKTIFF